jgi:hypothetical protein
VAAHQSQVPKLHEPLQQSASLPQIVLGSAQAHVPPLHEAEQQRASSVHGVEAGAHVQVPEGASQSLDVQS